MLSYRLCRTNLKSSRIQFSFSRRASDQCHNNQYDKYGSGCYTCGSSQDATPFACLLFSAQIEQHNYENNQDHDGTGIDQDLNCGNKLCLQGKVESGKHEKVGYQTDCGGYRVLARDGK